MIIRIVKLQFHKEKLDDFLFIFNQTKRKISAFEGCMGMQLVQDLSNPSVFFTYSRWESEEALSNYRQSDVFKIIWKSIKPWFEKPAEACSTVIYFDGFSNGKK